MKKRRNNSDRASTLQIALSTGLISIFAILLAIAAPTKMEKGPRQDLSGFQWVEGADASVGSGPLSVAIEDFRAHASLGICGTLLYDQTDSSGTFWTTSQDFEAPNDVFDDQAADDFVVPAGNTWTVQQVVARGVYFNGTPPPGGPAASFNVAFYSNAGGLPGAALPLGTFAGATYTNVAGTFTITLPSNLVLTAGTYWVSVQARMDFAPSAGQWGWTNRTVTSNSPAAWQNPGGGFGLGCLSWGARGATCSLDPTAPDQIFQIVGCLGAASPTPSPTPTATATPTATVYPTPTPCPLFTISGTVGQCTAGGPSGVALAGVTMTLTHSGGGSTTTTDDFGNYTSYALSCSAPVTVRPSKPARLPGSAGINTTDVIAVQRHFLAISLLTGCRLAAADCASPAGITTADVIAIQRFFLGLTTGIGDVGKYSFTPASRSYSQLLSNQTAQNYDTIVFGDAATPFANP